MMIFKAPSTKRLKPTQFGLRIRIILAAFCHAILTAILSLCTLPVHSHPIASETPQGLCRHLVSNGRTISLDSSFNDGDRDYFEVGGIRFGKHANEAAFVEHKGKETLISKIPFTDGKHRAITLRDDDVSLMRGSIYNNKDRKTYCLVAPFSGIGSSGHFQQYRALIIIQEHGASPARLIGQLIHY
jgi:hypothetical protein